MAAAKGKKMLRYHEPRYRLGGPDPKIGKQEMFLVIADIHRIETIPEGAPAYVDGGRAIIVCKGKDPRTYTAMRG